MSHAPVPVLSRLRNDNTFCDAILVCGSDEIRVHACVISQISPFFVTALTGSFKEAGSRSILLGDTTTRAIYVLLDYAYEIEYVKALRADYTLTLEVWALAHLYSVDSLLSAVEKEVIAHANPLNIVELIQFSKRYQSNTQVVDALFSFAALHFSGIDVKLLTIHQLEQLLVSPNLVATEWERVCALKEWRNGKEVDVADITRLVGLLHFELLEQSELYELFEDNGIWIPRDALVKVIKTRSGRGTGHFKSVRICSSCKVVIHGSQSCPQSMNYSDYNYAYNSTRKCRGNYISGSAVCISLTIPPFSGDYKFDRAASPIFCRLRNFVFSVLPCISDKLTLDLKVQVERRWSADDESNATTPTHALKNFTFHGWTKVAGYETAYSLSSKGKVGPYYLLETDFSQKNRVSDCHMVVTLVM